MKNLLSFLFLFALAVCVQAAPTPLVSVTVSNTTVTVPNMPAQSYSPTIQNGQITHSALTSTNALSINIYSTFNSSSTNNRVLIGTWYPSTTNAATETIVGTSQPAPTNYLSFDIVTTNAVTLSGTYGQ